MWNTIKPPIGHCGLAAGDASWPPGGHVVIRTESPVDHIRIDRHESSGKQCEWQVLTQ